MTGVEGVAGPCCTAAPPLFPLFADLRDRAVLVVGAGQVAARKAAALLACGARVTMVAPRVAPEAQALTERGARVERRAYRPGEAGAYRLVVTATDDPAVNEAVFADGEAAGVWVNAADDPAHCSVQLPAVLRRGPVTVAVSTAGSSPALASWLRDRIGDRFGTEIGTLAERLAAERAALHSVGASTEGLDWVRRIEELSASPAGEDRP